MNVCEKVYVGIITLLGLLALFVITVPAMPTLEQMMILWVLIGLATIAQFFEVQIADQRTYYPHNVFFFAGVLLLPPLLLVPLYAIPLAVDAWRRSWHSGRTVLRWCDLLFNVAAHTLTGVGAGWIYFALNANLTNLFQIGQVFAAIVAGATYVLGNHLLLRLADVLINRSTWRESAIWMTENLWTELIMAYLGYVVAVLWYINPVMILPMLGLMFLLQQALMIPRLQLEAQTDSKTGLLNVRYFNQHFDDWLARAKRQTRPLSVMMADLDFLRRINNNYGHLAGDIVLIGVSEIIRRTVRPQDIVGRFGGEEFAILLPDTDQEEAFRVAEAVRQAIAETNFEIPTSPTPIRTTITLGIACYPNDATTATDLLHHADVAVYQAKMDGRNRVICASDLFYRIKTEGGMGPDHSRSDERVDHPPKPKLLDLPVHVPHVAVDTLSDESVLLPRWYGWLTDTVLKSLVALIALALTVLGFAIQPAIDWGVMLVLVGLTVVAQLLRLKLFAMGDLSIAAALLFSAALLTGVPGLAFVSLAIVLTSILSENLNDPVTLWHRKLDLLHDWAIGLLAGLCPALLTPLFGVALTLNHLPLLIVPFFLMMLAYSYSGVALIAFNVSVATRATFRQVWADEFREAPGQYMLMALIGLCLALVYTMFGVTSLLLSVLPIFVMRFAQEPGLMHLMQLDRLSALLGQQLRPAAANPQTDPRTYMQATGGAVPLLRDADTARIERYLQFRDEIRAG
jgi:diguanylate cyclase (GGDEF)-like protein